jgi:hypothetical protein
VRTVNVFTSFVVGAPPSRQPAKGSTHGYDVVDPTRFNGIRWTAHAYWVFLLTHYVALRT